MLSAASRRHTQQSKYRLNNDDKSSKHIVDGSRQRPPAERSNDLNSTNRYETFKHRQEKLLDLYYSDSSPREAFTREQRTLTKELGRV